MCLRWRFFCFLERSLYFSNSLSGSFFFFLILLNYSFNLFFFFFFLRNRENLIKLEVFLIVGPKNLETPAHFISSLRPTLRRKKCPRTNEEGLNCQETLLRTILFSANRNHGRKKWHVTKGSFLEHPKGKRRCNETAMRE